MVSADQVAPWLAEREKYVLPPMKTSAPSWAADGSASVLLTAVARVFRKFRVTELASLSGAMTVGFPFDRPTALLGLFGATPSRIASRRATMASICSPDSA